MFQQRDTPARCIFKADEHRIIFVYSFLMKDILAYMKFFEFLFIQLIFFSLQPMLLSDLCSLVFVSYFVVQLIFYFI